MVKEEVEGRGSRSATETYEVLGVSKVVTEGARGEFHNFRDVPKISLTTQRNSPLTSRSSLHARRLRPRAV